MNGNDVLQLCLFIARGWIGVMIFAHGYRHLKAVRSGPGMANWFESLGLRNGPLQAWNVTLTELVFGPVLIAGFLTPLAYAGCASIVLVALVTNHWKNG
ncbi:MAG TPA: DoxX family protein, partial [Acidimicrobiia bacterium]|nr:DoxX family protein [Acidimicrobiia bacterium]